VLHAALKESGPRNGVRPTPEGHKASDERRTKDGYTNAEYTAAAAARRDPTASTRWILVRADATGVGMSTCPSSEANGCSTFWTFDRCQVRSSKCEGFHKSVDLG